MFSVSKKVNEPFTLSCGGLTLLKHNGDLFRTSLKSSSTSFVFLTPFESFVITGAQLLDSFVRFLSIRREASLIKADKLTVYFFKENLH